jgi:hypothetical protein
VIRWKVSTITSIWVSLAVTGSNLHPINWIGTGFFVIKKIDENKYQPFMVTNRHVLEGHDSVVIRLKEKET